jgi:hypothetical protein
MIQDVSNSPRKMSGKGAGMQGSGNLNKRRRLSCRASFGNLDPTLEQGWRFGVGQSRDGVEGSQSQRCKGGC